MLILILSLSKDEEAPTQLNAIDYIASNSGRTP